jgi:Na+/proline symporter
MMRGKLSWFTIACGISMTYAGGAAILTTASIGYSFKWYSLIDPISLIIGLFIAVLLFNHYRDNKGTTISELLSSDYKGLNVLTGVVSSFTFILIVAAQFVALSKLLAPYFPSVNPLLITFVVSTGIFSYVFFGGFNSVTKTDILQYILITLFLVCRCCFCLIQGG